jgi:hypothetical protein
MIIGKATFGCEGHKVELGPGGFNYMPARMVHEAWTTPGSVVFITVDGPWDVNSIFAPQLPWGPYRDLCIGHVRYGSEADIVTSPRHVRFTPNNGRCTAHPSQHFGLSVYEDTP